MPIPNALPKRAAALLLAALLPVSFSIPSAAQPAEPAPHPEVVVVVNGASPVSVAIGDYYRAKRNIPAANVLKLDIPRADPTLGNTPQEFVTTRAAFDAQIRVPIETFLRERDLVDGVRILVLASGIPHRYNPRACAFDGAYLRDCPRASVDAELAVLFSDLAGAGGLGANGEAVNAYYDSAVPFAAWRAAHPKAPLRYLVARLAGFQTPLDAATGVPTDVKALIDGAQAPARDGTLLIDEDPNTSPGRRAANLVLLRPIASLLRGRGVPVLHDQSARVIASPAALIGYAAWGSNDTNNAGAPFYGAVGGRVIPGRFAPRSIAVDLVSTNGRTFVVPTNYEQSLAADLIRLGASGVAANAFEPMLIGLARPSILFRNYFDGASAIESFYRSVPYLSWMNVYLGDPLMTTDLRLDEARDGDGDAVADAVDNCVDLPNKDQRDTDGDGFGNLCDADFDGDGRVTAGWGALPPGKTGDLDLLERAIATGRYDANLDLDGDRDVDADDGTIASLSLFLAPGPRGAPPRTNAGSQLTPGVN